MFIIELDLKQIFLNVANIINFTHKSYLQIPYEKNITNYLFFDLRFKF